MDMNIWSVLSHPEARLLEARVRVHGKQQRPVWASEEMNCVRRGQGWRSNSDWTGQDRTKGRK